MLLHAAFKKMVVLSIERNTSSAREIAIPYPTYFHPDGSESVRALVEWQRESSQRVSLVTMAAGQRQLTTNKVRHRLMAECEEDPRCTLLRCVGHEASPDLATAVRADHSLCLIHDRIPYRKNVGNLHVREHFHVRTFFKIEIVRWY